MQQRKMCEGCGLKVPSYGLPAERRRRWCSGCAKAEGKGAVRARAERGPEARAVAAAQAQGNQREASARELLGNARAAQKRRCEGRGAANLDQQRKMCEGCGLKTPKYGLPAERKRRWCAGCAAAEGRGAVSLEQPRCEGPQHGL